MKGLLVKDIRLMKNMRNSIIMIIVIAMGMGAYIKDASFIIVYLSLIGATFTSSTLSYDEFDNGYAFLFSLPVTRREYVIEKYGFGLLLGGGGWLIGTVIATTVGVARNTGTVTDNIMIALMLLPITVILVAVMLPFHIKFGGEKGRIAMLAAMGVFFVIILVGVKAAEMVQIDLDALYESLPVMRTGAIVTGAVAIAVGILLLSCRISMGIMKKKEF